MKKKLTALLLIAMLATTACTAGAKNQQSATEPESQTSLAEQETTPPTDAEETEQGTEQEAELIENEYEGLEVDAVILNRMAILPGFAVPVTVTVKNNGERSISYVQGSGSYEVPEALYVRFDDLQPVLTKDRVGGVMTMDYVTQELKPGESLEYTVYVMAIEPDEAFNDYTYDLESSEKTYIADEEFSALQERYPSLVAAQPGIYTGTVGFVYSVMDEDSDTLLFSEPTGYTETTIQISVSD